MKPQQMETILTNLIAHYEAEKLSIKNMQDECWEHQSYKKELMTEMDSKPSYENYMRMQKLVLDNNYETAKMLKAMQEMENKYDELINNLKKEIKSLPEDKHPYV
ncbi:unnamed protein product [Lactuca saligna]|uniref:Uncharacterized protein n=1 Tax=Lactuca saligna TaxID=75948 RepID=A0AA35UKB8_LACSI|nr:unnamed protein product [Lactuca saligna]